jgi:SAM-dependent methyltransferase
MPAPPDPGPLLQLLAGVRMNAALIAVLELRVCGHLATGPCTMKELAQRAGIAERGAQALLDVLVGLDLCKVEGGVYRNGPVADAYLVPERSTYLGDEEVGQFRAMYASWPKLTDVARSGAPAHDNDSPLMLDFWTVLTPAIARRQRPFAEEAVRILEHTTGDVSLLDVGGGAALFSLALLRQNPQGRATQLDWPHINRIATEEVKKANLSERFSTIDGDFRTTPPGGPYDVVVLSNIAHQESAATVKELIGRLHAALRPGGRLLISEFLVDDGRTGPPHSLLFNLTMLLNTRDGRSYERSNLARIIREGGFEEPSFHRVGPVSTLAVARRA